MRMQHVSYLSPAGLPGVELLSCPHVDVDFPAHMHDTLTIWVNDSGGEYFRFKGNTSILGQDGFGVVNAGEVHANGGLGETGRHLKTFYLDAAACALACGEQVPEFASIADGLHVDPAMHGSLRWLHELLAVSRDRLETQTAFCETFSTLFRRHATCSEQESAPDRGRFERMRTLLHDRMAEAVSLDELAAEAGCTQQHAIRLFRAGTGISPHAYLVCLRVASVRRMLANGACVIDAALACGFADQSHCTRWFRRLTGTTPAAYRLAVIS